MALENFVNDLVLVLYIVCFSVAGVCFLAVAFGCCLCCAPKSIKNKYLEEGLIYGEH